MKSKPKKTVLFEGKRVKLVFSPGESGYVNSMVGNTWMSPRVECEVKGYQYVFQSPIPKEVRDTLEAKGRISPKKRAELAAAAKRVDDDYETYAAAHAVEQAKQQEREQRDADARETARRLTLAAPAMRGVLVRTLEELGHSRAQADATRLAILDTLIGEIVSVLEATAPREPTSEVEKLIAEARED